jgi:uncharacterized RDD family membrane protein YckC
MQDEDPGQPPLHAGPAEVAEELQSFYVASSGKRFVNSVVDFLGCMLLAGFLVSLFAKLAAPIVGDIWLERLLTAAFQVIWIAAVMLYYGMEYLWGRTPGKFVTQTLVISADGGRPSLGQIIGRTFSRFIPFEALSYLFGGSYPVGWHDSLSNTRVVDKPRPPISSP